MFSPNLLTVLTLLTSLPHAISHGEHNQQPTDTSDWALQHMISEHHISNFDAGSFFNLHDYSSSGAWTRTDIQRTYGLFDASNSHVTQSQKDAVADKILSIFDKDLSGTVSYAEFTIGSAHGLKLPDLGYGPGHHGDDEYEYEIHHFEKFHDENTREEDLIHPEDIAHFKMHDEREAEEERVRNLDRAGERADRTEVENKDGIRDHVAEEKELWRRVAGQRFVQHVGLAEDNDEGEFEARLEQTLEAIDEQQRAGLLDYRFKRQAFYVCASILAWVVFWDLADQNQASVLSRFLAWGTVLAAFWLARVV